MNTTKTVLTAIHKSDRPLGSLLLLPFHITSHCKTPNKIPAKTNQRKLVPNAGMRSVILLSTKAPSAFIPNPNWAV